MDAKADASGKAGARAEDRGELAAWELPPVTVTEPQEIAKYEQRFGLKPEDHRALVERGLKALAEEAQRWEAAVLEAGRQAEQATQEATEAARGRVEELAAAARDAVDGAHDRAAAGVRARARRARASIEAAARQAEGKVGALLGLRQEAVSAATEKMDGALEAAANEHVAERQPEMAEAAQTIEMLGSRAARKLADDALEAGRAWPASEARGLPGLQKVGRELALQVGRKVGTRAGQAAMTTARQAAANVGGPNAIARMEADVRRATEIAKDQGAQASGELTSTLQETAEAYAQTLVESAAQARAKVDQAERQALRGLARARARARRGVEREHQAALARVDELGQTSAQAARRLAERRRDAVVGTAATFIQRTVRRAREEGELPAPEAWERMLTTVTERVRSLAAQGLSATREWGPRGQARVGRAAGQSVASLQAMAARAVGRLQSRGRAARRGLSAAQHANERLVGKLVATWTRQSEEAVGAFEQGARAWVETLEGTLRAGRDGWRENLTAWNVRLETSRAATRARIAQGVPRDAARALRHAEMKLIGRVARLYAAGPGQRGTKEREIYRALSGLSRAELWAVQDLYRDRLGTSLVTMLRDELSGQELKLALALLNHSRVRAAALAIELAMGESLGPNMAWMEETLRGLNAKERAAVARLLPFGTAMAGAWFAHQGRDGEVVAALLANDVAKADALRLNEAIEDEDREKANDILAGKTDAEREAILRAYEGVLQQVEPGEHRKFAADVAEHFEGSDAALLRATAAGDEDGVAIARWDIALVSGEKADVDRAIAALDFPDLQPAGLDSEDADVRKQAERKREAAVRRRRALMDRYKASHLGRSMDEMVNRAVRGDLSDEARAAMRDALWDGKPSDVNAFLLGVSAGPKGAADLQSWLDGKTPGEVAKLDAALKARTGKDIEETLKEHFEGNDLRKLQHAGIEHVTSAKELRARVMANMKYEEGGDALMLENYTRFQMLYDQVGDWDKATPAQKEQLWRLAKYVEDDTDSYEQAKDELADEVAMGLEIAGAAALTGLTAGGAGPVALMMAQAAFSGATLVAKRQIRGRSYTRKDLVEDLATGAVSVATAGVGAKAGLLDRMGERVAGRVGARLGSKVLGEMTAEGVKKVIEETVKAAVPEAIAVAWDDKTLRQAVTSVLVTAAGAGLGAAVGKGVELHLPFGEPTTLVQAVLSEEATGLSSEAITVLANPETWDGDTLRKLLAALGKKALTAPLDAASKTAGAAWATRRGH